MTKRQIILLAILAVIAACFAAIYFFYDPSKQDIFPRCPFLLATGLECPGCGSQRAIHALLHGEFAEAWHFNAMFVIFLPIIAVYGAAEFLRTKLPRFYSAINSPRCIWVIFTVIVLWWILRNVYHFIS